MRKDYSKPWMIRHPVNCDRKIAEDIMSLALLYYNQLMFESGRKCDIEIGRFNQLLCLGGKTQDSLSAIEMHKLAVKNYKGGKRS